MLNAKLQKKIREENKKIIKTCIERRDLRYDIKSMINKVKI